MLSRFEDMDLVALMELCSSLRSFDLGLGWENMGLWGTGCYHGAIRRNMVA